ncbi:hypothetical protein EDC04DRAFT_2607265 [Pisolithus marmoratus]|nr:hypothetical protein EDC04DRAFT_2607265 [Pisolithus marmoratus]
MPCISPQGNPIPSVASSTKLTHPLPHHPHAMYQPQGNPIPSLMHSAELTHPPLHHPHTVYQPPSCTMSDGDPSSTLYLASTLLVWGVKSMLLSISWLHMLLWLATRDLMAKSMLAGCGSAYNCCFCDFWSMPAHAGWPNLLSFSVGQHVTSANLWGTVPKKRGEGVMYTVGVSAPGGT